MPTDNEKYAVITGGRTGIGLATLKLFSKNRINCIPVVHRENEDFKDEIDNLRIKYGVSIIPIFIDLSDEESVKNGCKQIINGKYPVEILVNSAGIKGNDSSFLMTALGDIKKLFDVNFFNTLLMTQYMSRIMMRRKKGSIINITSIAAFGEDTSQMEYSASKAALECATRKLARELSLFGIRVNSIAPGWTMTNMVEDLDKQNLETLKSGLPYARFATPEEVAQAVLFLASEQASYISGATIRVDGGGFDLRKFISHKD